MMKTEDSLYSQNINNLMMMNNLRAYLSVEEELAFMQLLFTSSASIRGGNFGLKRKDVEKILNIKNDDEAFFSFIDRTNEALSRYFHVIYDEKRERAVVMMRVSAKDAKSTLSKEALAILLYMFYQQEVLNHEFTLLQQVLTDFGHETLSASSKLQANIDQLKKIGAVEDYDQGTKEKAYSLTTIGVHMFSDSFLRRSAEFAHSTQLSKEEVLKFFKRYNLYVQEEKE